MVADGWAMAYREYSLDYVPQEDDARSAKRGIWQTEFVPPWDWRKQKRTQTEAKQQAGCVIKGNISTRTGERIYHVPGGQYYDKTAISTSAVERWFCSEAEARAAVVGFPHRRMFMENFVMNATLTNEELDAASASSAAVCLFYCQCQGDIQDPEELDATTDSAATACCFCGGAMCGAGAD